MFSLANVVFIQRDVTTKGLNLLLSEYVRSICSSTTYLSCDHSSFILHTSSRCSIQRNRDECNRIGPLSVYLDAGQIILDHVKRSESTH